MSMAYECHSKKIKIKEMSMAYECHGKKKYLKK